MSKKSLIFFWILILTALAIMTAKAQEPRARELYVSPRLELGMYYQLPTLPPVFGDPQTMPQLSSSILPASPTTSEFILQSPYPSYYDYRQPLLRRPLPFLGPPGQTVKIQMIQPNEIQIISPPLFGGPPRPRELYTSPR